MKDAVEGVPTAQPCIVVRGKLNAIRVFSRNVV